MSTNREERALFYEDQYLGAGDLNTAVGYARGRLARHALGAHTWGIAAGLALVERPIPGVTQVDYYLTPGYAWDGFGRVIAALEPVRLPADLFASLKYDPAVDAAGTGRLLEVWARYQEERTLAEADGYTSCETESRPRRVLETFRFVVGPQSSPEGQLVVNGRPANAETAAQQLNPQAALIKDHSVPFQEWPEDENRAVWLLPVGYARWQPAAGGGGALLPREPEDLIAEKAFRRYIGVVAGQVEAAGAAIRLHNRGQPYSVVASGELVWVEGDLRVEGDIRPFGKSLDFRGVDGARHDDMEMLVRRISPGGIANDLQVVIGHAATGENRFSVGPLSAGQFQTALTVLDAGRVGIGTATPDPALKLDIQGDFGRTNGSATLHLFGSTLGDTGGGILSIKSGGGIVAFDGNDSLGIGTATPDPALKLDIQGDFGRTNGSATLHLFGSTLGDTGGGILSIKSGGGTVAFDGDDNVGIGTAAPVAPLHVSGDIVIGSRASSTVPRALPAGATMLWNDATWLRLNQNLDFSKPLFGVHTPGLFAPVSLNVGGLNGWGDPGARNAWFSGNIGVGHVQLRERLDVNGSIRLGVGGGLFAPGGEENLRVLRGTVRGGFNDSNTGFAVNWVGTGLCDITFTTPFAARPSAAVTQIFPSLDNFGAGGNTLDNAVLVGIDSAHMRVKVGDAAGEASNRAFSFIVIGPR